MHISATEMVISKKGLSNPMGFWVLFLGSSRETDPQLREAPHQALVTTIFQEIPEKRPWSYLFRITSSI